MSTPSLLTVVRSHRAIRHAGFFIASILAIAAASLARAQDGCDSHWGTPFSFASSSNPHDLTVGDWNGDGIPDLAIANASGTVRLFRGTGIVPLTSSSFVSNGSVSVPYSPFAIKAVDLNGDAILDLVTANYNTGTISVLLGNGTSGIGNGSFAAPLNFAAGIHPFDLVAADFDQDGRVDIAVSDNDCNSGGAWVLLALPPTTPGQPRFAPPTSYPLGCTAAMIATSDFNGDHRPDLAVALYSSGTVKVLLSAPGGGFTTSTVLSGLTHPYDVRALDLDGDGISDLVSCAGGGLRVSWGLGSAGNGNGTFSPGVIVLTGDVGMCAPGDQNADGRIDLVPAISGSTFELLVQTAPRTFLLEPDQLRWSGSLPPKLADLDLDGRADLVAVQYTANTVSVAQSLCATPTIPPPPPPPTPDPGAWAAQGRRVADGANAQTGAILLPDGSGGSFVVWIEAAATNYVMAQRLSATGERLWGATGVRVCDYSQNQVAPSAIVDGAGGLYVSWLAIPNSTRLRYLQHLLPSGGVAPGWGLCGRLLSNATNDLYWYSPWTPAGMAPDGSGGVFIVANERQPSSTSWAILYRIGSDGLTAPGWPSAGRFMAGGFTSEFDSDVPVQESLIPLPGGGFNAVVTREQYTAGENHLTERTLAWFLSVTNTGAVTRVEPDIWLTHGKTLLVAPMANGSSVVTWPALEGNMRAMGLGPACEHVWSSILASSGSVAGSTPARAASDGAGGAFFLWETFSADGLDLVGTRLSSDGSVSPNWGLPVAWASPPASQGESQFSSDDEGGVVVVWSDTRLGNNDVYFNRFGPSGTARAGWPVDGVSLVSMIGEQRHARVVMAGPLSAIAAWEDSRTGVSQLYAQRIALDQPVAVAASLRSFTASPERVQLMWEVREMTSPPRIERSVTSSIWMPLGTGMLDGEHHVAWEDADVIPGQRIGYRLVDSGSGVVVPGSEAWIDVPTGLSFALKGLDPNPAGADAGVSFTLPSAATARLEIFDVSGRRVFGREVGTLGAGRHRLPLDGAALSAGFYMLRLTQGAETRVQRGLLLR